MRHIDADALTQYLIKRGFYPAIVKRAIEDAPTADVVEVVRCKDCKEREVCPDTLLWCNQMERLVPPNGFCHCGERIEENAEKL